MKYINDVSYNINDDDIVKEYEILKKFKSHNILNERLELYKDFSINLLYLIFETYFGMDYIKNEKQAKGHYKWCFRKVVEDFQEIEINFYDNTQLYEYFLEYYMKTLYSNADYKPLLHHKKLFENLFDNKKNNKSSKNLNNLIELYEIFDDSLINKNKSLYC